jgi:hypothetical protein
MSLSANGKHNVIILALLVVILTGVVLGFTIYYLVDMQNKRIKVSYVDATNQGIQAQNVPTVIPNAITFSGKQGTILFWAYVNQLPKTDFTLVSFGGAPSNTVAALATNMKQNMAFNVITTQGAPSMTANMACADSATCTAVESIHLPYVPMKRWVHYAFTVDIDRKKLLGYVDGELVTQGSVSANSAMPNGNNLIIGGLQDLQMIVSRVGYVPTVMQAQEIQREYYQGPTYTLMAKYGIPPYGLRSPVYRQS